jgi:hypothetical protein
VPNSTYSDRMPRRRLWRDSSSNGLDEVFGGDGMPRCCKVRLTTGESIEAGLQPAFALEAPQALTATNRPLYRSAVR